MPTHPKIAKLDAHERVALRDLESSIKSARQRVAIIVHAAARDRKLVVSGRNREKLYNQIGAVYLQLDNGLKDWSKDLIKKGAIDWHDEAIKDIKGQTGTDPSNKITRFSREYAEDVFKRVTPENGRSLAAVVTDRMAQEDIKALRAATVDVYRQASLSGMTLNQIHAGIQEKWDTIAGDQAAFRFRDASGREWSNARYLNMLVRTTTARVARDSYFDTLTQNGDDLAVVQNVDGEACEICQAWDGVIISISGASDKYPSYQQALDAGCFHPNCRCMAERVDETIDKDAIKAQAETPSPDFTRADGETDTEYRNRMTEQVQTYNDEFSGEAGKEDPDAKEKVITDTAKRDADRAEAERKAAEKAAKEELLLKGREFRDATIAAQMKTRKTVAAALKKVPDPVWGLIAKDSRPLVFETHRSKAYYQHATRTINIGRNPEKWHGHPSVTHHELGHDLHYTTGAIDGTKINTQLDSAMRKDIYAWEQDARKRLGDDKFVETYSRHKSMNAHRDILKQSGIDSENGIFETSMDNRHRSSGYLDTIGGMTKGKWGDGHDFDVYMSPTGGAKEAYANIFRAIINGWTEYDKAFPLTTQWIRSSLSL